MLKPVNDRLIVKKIQQEQVGSIILSGAQSDSLFPTFRGKVIAVSNTITIDVEVNDTVIYPKQCGIPLEDNGEKIVMLTEKEVLAVEQMTN